MNKRTLLVGLDAACWAYLNPLLEQGRLPTLQKLIDSGSRGTLMSTLPAATPVAWSSIVTGKNPGKHGVFDMMWRPSESQELSMLNSSVRQGTPFWKRLNERGLRVGLANVPFTHPAAPMDGFTLCGFGTAGVTSGLAYPEEALSLVEASLGHYEPMVDFGAIKQASQDQILELESNHQSHQVDAAILLANHYKVDVLAINLMLPDHANHRLRDMALVEEAIIKSDADVQRLITEFEPDNVMLISDHGSRRLKGEFLLSAWLRDRGYSTWQPRKTEDQSEPLNWILMQWLRRHYGMKGSAERYTRNFLKSIVPVLPRFVEDRFWDQVEKSVPFARQHVKYSNRLDYSNSKVYFGNRASGVLFINRSDRGPVGMVTPKELPELLDQLTEQLLQIEDPQSGEPLISSVYLADRLYEGPAIARAPDLILDGYQTDWNIVTPYSRESRAQESQNRYFVDSPNTFGWHSRDGVFVFSGPDFQTNEATKEWHVMDVPATLLQINDTPIPGDFDGKVMEETIEPGFLTDHPIQYQPGDTAQSPSLENVLPADEEQAIMENLRALGYVD